MKTLLYKQIFKIPLKEAIRLGKQIKNEIGGIIIKDGYQYTTDGYYAFKRPVTPEMEEEGLAINQFLPTDGVSKIELEDQCPQSMDIAKQLDQIIARHESTQSITLSIDILERVLAIAKLQSDNPKHKPNSITLSIPTNSFQPLLITQGKDNQVQFLIMPRAD